MIEILLLIFAVMIALSAFKIIVKLFWAVMAPLSTLAAVFILLYLFSSLVGK